MADIEISKIILPRGPAVDLPGRPKQLFPPVWTAPLDEGELAFATDQSRLFIGADPDNELKQADRLAFPYQNIEVIGENSVDAFASLHGENMREGSARDFYRVDLPVAANWTVLPVFWLPPTNGLQASVKYVVLDAMGRCLRSGNHNIEIFEGVLTFDDEAEMVRSLETGLPDYDPTTAFAQVGLRYALADGVRLSYRNTTGAAISLLWRISRP